MLPLKTFKPTEINRKIKMNKEEKKEYKMVLYKHVKPDGTVSLYRYDMSKDLTTGLPNKTLIESYGVCLGPVGGTFIQETEELPLEEVLESILAINNTTVDEKFSKMAADAKKVISDLANKFKKEVV